MNIKTCLRLALALGLSALTVPTVEAQIAAQGTYSAATSQVAPRTYTVCSNLVLTPSQYLGSGTITNTNNFASLLGANWPSWLTNQGVYASAPTLLPNGSAHEVGLWAVIQTTNALQHSSNMVVTVYPAYDTTGGSGSSLAERYGQLFCTNSPLLTWNIPYLTNGVFGTNLTIPSWCPATSLGYVISNGVTSNTTFSLFQENTP
jgi:hypothetical protein